MKKYNILFFFIAFTVLAVISSYFLTFMVLPRAVAQSGGDAVKAEEKIPSDLIESPNTKQPAMEAPVPPSASKPQELSDLKPIENVAPKEGMDLLPKFDEYIYDSRGKRDPFQPFKAFLENSGSGDSRSSNEHPLTKYSLESLSVVAIMWDTGNSRAMIKTPDNNFHSVAKKSLIGRNNGYVAAIREGEIVVIEKFYSDGQSRLQTKLLELKK